MSEARPTPQYKLIDLARQRHSYGTAEKYPALSTRLKHAVRTGYPQPCLFDIGETCLLALRRLRPIEAVTVSTSDHNYFLSDRELAVTDVQVFGFDASQPMLVESIQLLLDLQQGAAVFCEGRVVAHDLRRRNPAVVLVTNIYEGPQ